MKDLAPEIIERVFISDKPFEKKIKYLMTLSKEELIQAIEHSMYICKTYSDKYYNSIEWKTEVEKGRQELLKKLDKVKDNIEIEHKQEEIIKETNNILKRK